MLGDVLLIEDKHRLAGSKIVEAALKLGDERVVIGISGESGAGKSELGHVIARELRHHGRPAKSISTDNFYLIHPLERRKWRETRGVKNAVGYEEYDWAAINKMVEEFHRGQKSTLPCVDLVTEEIDQLTTDFQSIKVLVLDGLYAIKTERMDLRVFIELTYHETKKAQRVRGKEQTDDFRMQVLEQEHQCVLALRRNANLLITKSYEVIEGDMPLLEKAAQ